MKRINAFLLAVAMVLILVSCGGSANQQETEKKNNISSTQKTTIEETEKKEEITMESVPTIAVGEKVTTENSEFKIDYFDITDDVMPPQPGNWYTHYEADAGKMYVDICFAYKNMAASNVDADEIILGKLIYNNKYEYKGFSIIEKDNRSSFTYTNITKISPLSTEYVHYLFEIPKEVEESGGSIVLQMNIDGERYKVVVRKGDGLATEITTGEVGKTSGVIVLGETVVTKNAEFNVDYATITNDVMPPQPGNWYTHYEADAGKVYVDICFAYKNTKDKSVDADEIIFAKLKYADKYDYLGFSMIEKDSRSNFTYSNITKISPLSTEYVHYLFEVPEEIKDSGSSIEITFTVDGNTYTYKVR